MEIRRKYIGLLGRRCVSLKRIGDWVLETLKISTRPSWLNKHGNSSINVTIFAGIFQGRYCAKGGFLDAGKGFRPSYAWRIILFGRELLVAGLMKSIGKGHSTYVW